MMDNKVHCFLLVTMFFLGACGDDGPYLEDGDDEGETGDGEKEKGCAPHHQFTTGYILDCQGAGTGWLITDVYGAGNANPITTCLAWNDPQNIPEHPTSADCASLPFDEIPFEISTPAACCNDDASQDGILTTCEEDCGYVACKAAVAAIRTSAEDLEPPPDAPDIVVNAFETSKGDLHAYADLLETPGSLKTCATKVAKGAGEVVSLKLNGGVSNSGTLGHIKDATLYLGCTLDPDDPYISSGEVCSEPTNIPPAMAEQESGGPITGGTLTITGPDNFQSLATVRNATVTTREAFAGYGPIIFSLSSLEADLIGASIGPFELRDAHLSLADPASTTRVGETLTFVPGTLRFAVSAIVYLDGEPLFGGLPLIAEYGNDAPATAIREIDGTFFFEDATFMLGDYTAVLATEPSVLAPAQ